MDAFQHWAYTNAQTDTVTALAADPDACDAQWALQWDRFMPDTDYSGLEQEKMTGWHRKLHIFRYPFY